MLSNIRIKTLIASAMALLAALVVVMAALGLYGVSHTEQQFKSVTLREAKTHQLMLRVKYLMESNRSQVLQALQHNPGFDWAALHDHPLDIHFATIDDNTSKLKSAWSQYLETIDADDEKRLAETWYDKSGHLGVTSIGDAAVAIKAGEWDKAEGVLIKAINPTYRASMVAADALTAQLRQRGVDNDAAVAARIAAVRYSLIGALLVALAMAVAVGATLVRGITAPLSEAVRIARRVADGDLSTSIDVTSTNELGVLLTALKDMNRSLSKVVGTVRSNAVSIAEGAREIAGGNADLSHRTEDQAASLQQTASSMEQLSSTVRSNADSARQASELAGTASDVAVQGGEVVSRVVATMSDIAQSSKKISDIIGVIDGIAFQTNILALNAAVEAARAGEQGRGFAVVASEVRSLAQRSAQAAKEIASLINASVEKVESGSEQVGAAGQTMDKVVSQVKRVTSLIGEISAATQEQTSGIGEVGRAVTQLDQTTQQNAALVEQAAAAATRLQDQAAELVKSVELFKLSGQTA